MSCSQLSVINSSLTFSIHLLTEPNGSFISMRSTNNYWLFLPLFFSNLI